MADAIHQQPTVLDLGRMPYAAAYAEQVRHVDEVQAARARSAPHPGTVAGVILLVEHDPVITVSQRAGAGQHLLAGPEVLARHGVEVVPTDRGGDITYHGPGQLVVYPILDLNLLNLGLHEYMRLLEASVIGACATWGIEAKRDSAATGVWVEDGDAGLAKVCAMGVRVRRWVSMHGLAINLTTNLEHFGFIVPCGLAGRGVTSLQKVLGAGCPTMDELKGVLVRELCVRIAEAGETAATKRAAVEG